MSEKKFNSNNSAYLLSKFNHILSIQITLSVLMIRRSLTKTKVCLYQYYLNRTSSEL